MGEASQKKMERLTTEADMRWRVFIGKIGVLYNKSRIHWDPRYHCIVQFSPDHLYQNEKETPSTPLLPPKKRTNTPHNDDQVSFETDPQFVHICLFIGLL